MISKIEEKEKAIALRRKGLSYREILTEIPVSKSSLSLWLRSVGLSKKQKQRLTEKKIQAALRGAQSKREQRIKVTAEIERTALEDIKNISKKELWLIGIALYWAEGSKEKEWRPGSGVRFTNSDPNMIKLFLKWLKDVADVSEDSIRFSIFIHENSKNDLNAVIRHWSKVVSSPKKDFVRVYFKKNKIRTNRKNTGDSYFGVLRIEVRASSTLNRKIAGWVKGINRYYWGVV